jgi:hypothetical protein
MIKRPPMIRDAPKYWDTLKDSLRKIPFTITTAIYAIARTKAVTVVEFAAR